MTISPFEDEHPHVDLGHAVDKPFLNSALTIVATEVMATISQLPAAEENPDANTYKGLDPDQLERRMRALRYPPPGLGRKKGRHGRKPN